MTAATQALAATAWTGANAVPNLGVGGALHVHTFADLTVATTAIDEINDIFEIAYLPPGIKVHGFIVTATDMDSGSPALAYKLRVYGVDLVTRFTDSTIAYQGFGRGIGLQLIQSLDSIATSGVRPDITLLLDLDAETGLRRNRGMDKTDRFELEDIIFHKRVRKGFLELAAQQPGRIKLIDAYLNRVEISKRVLDIMKELIWH